MDDIIEITVKNWNKYNPKLNQKTKTWFRFNSDLLHDPYLYGSPMGIKLTFIVLLTACCREDKETIRISLRQIKSVLGSKKFNVFKALEALNSGGLITFTGSTYIHTNIQTDIAIDTKVSLGERSISNRKEKNTVIESPAETEEKEPDYYKIYYAWNNNRGKLPIARKLTQARKKACAAKWKEHPDESFWVDAAKKMAEDKWCNGGSDGNWRADFDYYIRKDNALKYHEKPSIEPTIRRIEV